MAKPKFQPPEVDFAPSDTEVSGIFGDLSPQQAPAGQRVISLIPVDLIDPSPYQARKEEDFDPVDLARFADQMQEEGFTSIIWVRPSPDKKGRYELLYGERRLRAAKLVQLKPKPKFTEISCEVRTDYTNADPDRIRFLGFFENADRKGLRASHEAIFFRDLLALKGLNKQSVYTLATLAKRVKRSENYIQDRLRLLELPEDVRSAYDRNPSIALRSLYEVARLSDSAERAPLLELMIAGNYSVSKLRGVVNSLLEEEQATPPPPKPAANTVLPSTKPSSAPANSDRSPAIHLVTSSSAPQEEIASQEALPSDAPEPSSSVNERSQRAYKKIINQDATTIRDILKRWETLANNGELAHLIRQHAQSIQELTRPFLGLSETVDGGITEVASVETLVAQE